MFSSPTKKSSSESKSLLSPTISLTSSPSSPTRKHATGRENYWTLYDGTDNDLGMPPLGQTTIFLSLDLDPDNLKKAFACIHQTQMTNPIYTRDIFFGVLNSHAPTRFSPASDEQQAYEAEQKAAFFYPSALHPPEPQTWIMFLLTVWREFQNRGIRFNQVKNTMDSNLRVSIKPLQIVISDDPFNPVRMISSPFTVQSFMTIKTFDWAFHINMLFQNGISPMFLYRQKMAQNIYIQNGLTPVQASISHEIQTSNQLLRPLARHASITGRLCLTSIAEDRDLPVRTSSPEAKSLSSLGSLELLSDPELNIDTTPSSFTQNSLLPLLGSEPLPHALAFSFAEAENLILCNPRLKELLEIQKNLSKHLKKLEKECSALTHFIAGQALALAAQYSKVTPCLKSVAKERIFLDFSQQLKNRLARVSHTETNSTLSIAHWVQTDWYRSEIETLNTPRSCWSRRSCCSIKSQTRSAKIAYQIGSVFYDPTPIINPSRTHQHLSPLSQK